MEKETKNINIFIWVSCIIFSLPIMLTGVYYRDDAFRVVTGDGPWGWAGRQGADLIAHIFYLSRSNIDSYPLGYIISIVIICYILTFIAKKNLSIDAIYAKVTLPLLFVSPLFLQNLAYRFDSAGMVISLALSVLAFYLSKNKDNKYRLKSTLLLFLSLTIYQPCVNIFLGLIATHIAFNIKNTDESKFQSLLKDSSVFITSYVIYYIFEKIKLGNIGGGRASIIPLSDVILSLEIVFYQTWEILKLLYTGYIKWIASTLLVLFLFLSMQNTYKIYTLSKKDKIYIIKIVACLVSIPFLLFFSTTGVSFLLVEKITDVRVLVGFSAVPFFFVVGITKYIPQRGRFFPTGIFIFIACVISFQFANALKAQREYEKEIISYISYDLSNLNITSQPIYVAGSVGLSPVSEVISSHQPIIGKILSPLEPWIARPLLLAYGHKNTVQLWDGDPKEIIELLCQKNPMPLRDNYFYSIYKSDDYYLVFFKEKNNLCANF
ncbi:glucosyltransferase domain-containing protein [Pectobacterium polonicum]|uniref:glucosyltransferase domain-containing protein n=1 Tax=Pectobacterium polonicum TaxID=2485124 RepID=UPI002B24C3B1|nr:glucosyltransferase domain-containing protein [Pectobacterium polonicum]